MTIIDLLNKIANGEEVHAKFNVDGCDIEIDFYNNKEFEARTLLPEEFSIAKLLRSLNDTVEILEEENEIKKEELFTIDDSMTKVSLVAWQKANNGIFKKKIDELIDAVNKLKEDK